MMELLKGLNPQVAVLVIGLWLVREFLGWARNFVTDILAFKREPESDLSAAEGRQILDAIKTVAEHIGSLTELNRSFVYEMKELKSAVGRVEADVEDLKKLKALVSP